MTRRSLPSATETLSRATLAVALAASAACSATSATSATPVGDARAAAAPLAPAALDRSLFARDANGSISELDLQKVLDAKIEVDFPARVGVVALARPFEAGATGRPGLEGTIAKTMTRALEGTPEFALVTDVSTAMPSPTGIEGLRTIAARYRLRYLVVCSTTYEGRSHLNNWAWLYPTVVGLFLAPGVTVGSEGFVQASLFDVKTGTVLHTATEPFATSSVSWIVGSDREHESVDGAAIGRATAVAAQSVVAATTALAAWSKRPDTGVASTTP